MLLSQIPNSYRIKFSDADFKESEHPRGGQENPGQFVKKGAGGTKKVASRSNADLQKAFKEKTHVSGPVKALSDGHTREEAMKKAKALRAKGVFANIWHQSGPKTGPKSQYFISVPMDKEEREKKMESTSTFKDKKLREVDLKINKPEILKQINIPPTLYHVTVSGEAGKNIKSEGLTTSGHGKASEIGESEGRIYLTNDKYGILDSPEWEGKDTVVFEVKTEGLNLRLDPEYYKDFEDDPEALIKFANNKPSPEGGLYVYATKNIDASKIKGE